MLPLEERLKNIEQQFRQLERTVYYGHPNEDKVFTGVIKNVFCSLNDDDSCTGYLEVSPWTPYEPNVDGDLVFIEKDHHPLEFVDTDTRVERVYVNNVPPDLLRLFYRKGETVKYWHYSGTGILNDLADKIKGSYVTTVDEWAFWARIDWDNGANKYTFTAVDYAVEAQDTGFPDIQLCDDSEDTFSGHCDDFDNMFGVVRNKRGATPFVTKVYRFVNPNSASSPKFEYYFHNRVVAHFGKIKTIDSDACLTTAAVRPCDKDGTYISSNAAIVVNVKTWTCMTNGLCAKVGDVIPYILYTESEGIWLNPTKTVSIAYLCSSGTEVSNLSRLEFADVDFDIAHTAASDCESEDTIAQISTKGLIVKDYTGDGSDHAKKLVFDSTGPANSAPDVEQIAFTAVEADEILTGYSGCSEAQRTIKKVTLKGWLNTTTHCIVTDVVCDPDTGMLTVTKTPFPFPTNDVSGTDCGS